MASEKKGMAIIFHSGSYDRLHHGFAVALAALALGREVRFFFTYWALSYLRRGATVPPQVDEGNQEKLRILQQNLDKGHLENFPTLVQQAKLLGARFYACTHSMSLLNISRDELREEVDKSMGLTTFLKETAEDQILFI